MPVVVGTVIVPVLTIEPKLGDVNVGELANTREPVPVIAVAPLYSYAQLALVVPLINIQVTVNDTPAGIVATVLEPDD